MITIGVLALQGAFTDHVNTFNALKREDLHVLEVKTAEHLEKCIGLVIPGGESTAMRIIGGGEEALNRKETILGALYHFVHVLRKPVWGTCAGCILLGDDMITADMSEVSPGLIGGIPISVCRNYFGRQSGSFVSPLLAHGRLFSIANKLPSLCIRAPAILAANSHVEILGELENKGKRVIAAAAYKNIFVTIFHPELTDQTTIHQFFVEEFVEKMRNKNKIEENKIEENKIEENKIEENKFEENKFEENKIEENKIEENKIEETKIEENKFEEKEEIKREHLQTRGSA